MSHDAPKFKFGFAVDKPDELTRLRAEVDKLTLELSAYREAGTNEPWKGWKELRADLATARRERDEARRTVEQLRAALLDSPLIYTQTEVENARLRAALEKIAEHPTVDELINGEYCDHAHQHIAREALAATPAPEDKL